MSSNTEGPRANRQSSAPNATKTTRAGTKPQGGGLNPMFIGIIIGVLLGMAIALAVALFVSRNSGSANVGDKVKQPEQLTKIAPPSGVSTPSQQIASPAKTGDAAKDGKPRFEFYDILPGDKSAAGSAGSKAPVQAVAPALPVPIPPATKAPAPLNPAVGSNAPVTVVNGRPSGVTVSGVAPTTDAPASTAGPNFALQAGAFQNESDAESLKAKIAFAGYEATVRPVNVPDKGTLYRVRLGTYRNMDEVNRVRAALAQNGITASVVKVE